MSAIVFTPPTPAQAELLMLAGAVKRENYEAARKLLADKPEPRP